MSDRYEPAAFEAKWQARWRDANLFATREEPEKPKFYGLDFFPYPSGAGLSVGHVRNYLGSDVVCRMKAMQGFNVLHPMGFDAFGLPAENEAIAKRTHPAPMIERYADTYRRQMELVGIGYDWSRSFKSSDPDYYRWTQWIFKLLYERGLAYRRLASVNWCPVDKTVLADEEVVAGRCWRCDSPVERKQIPQWFFKITEYAQRLLDDLDDLDWPEGIKQMQRNWIGRSEGVEFAMKVSPTTPSAGDETDFRVLPKERGLSFRVFTTRIDTIFGMTFCVLSPEHPLLPNLLAKVDVGHRRAVAAYQAAAKRLSDADRQAATREKTGVFTGAHAINPANGKRVPIYVADYVLMGYGTGAIMAVPGHDERDFEFARKYGLDVVRVIAPSDGSEPDLPWTNKEGAVLVNSGEYSGKPVKEAQRQLGEWMEALGLGERKIQFKLRDWLISRQRYWGCPIPILYTADGHDHAVADECLPVTLPDVENYEPGDDGSSPLARIPEFVNATDANGRLGRRETDTMGGFACSSWYFLRFCDPHNDKAAWDPEAVKRWMPVDCYVGGAEHAVMHLLYARFWTKVLFDAGLVPVNEPFKRLVNQGMVQAPTPYRKPRPGEALAIGEEGVRITFEEAAALPKDEVFIRNEKMSKSKGNVVTPEEAVARHGADALRVFELFVAPFDMDVVWSEEGMSGAVRFLHRVFKLASDLRPTYDRQWSERIGAADLGPAAKDLRRATHQSIRKCGGDLDRFAFNTYVAELMKFVNAMNDFLKKERRDDDALAGSEALETLILLLAPAAPHSADELWASLGKDGFTYRAAWPTFSEELARDETVTIAVQVNGKLRDTLELPADADNATLEEAALASPKVRVFTEGHGVRKIIVVPKKLVNLVVN
ncbi:MAG: leucine--tRNA ligase [Fimbriimonadaceae bacterium]|nr:leucine--tRNA ligase [Fimbriimonadaceae bacterium]